jgi:hypothetical protein
LQRHLDAISTLARDPAKRYSARLRSPEPQVVTDVRPHKEILMLRRAWMLVFALACTLSPAAALAGSIQGIEGTLSTVFQKEQSSFSGLGLQLHVAGPASLPDLTFVPTLQYWSQRANVSDFGIRSQRSDAMLGVESRWTFSQVSMAPYVGAGYGLHFFNTDFSAPSLGVPSAQQSFTRGAFSVLGGVTMPLAGRLQNDFGASYDFAGAAAQFKLNWGFRFKF